MRYPNGLFTWADLTTTDVAAAKAFYQGLFGWRMQDIPTPMGPSYTMCFLGEDRVAGIGPTPAGYQAFTPTAWTCYVNVADVDAVLARVAPAGGRVVMPAMDVMDQGRMALLADPSGAVLGLWQPGTHQGADVFNIAGAMAWNELQSRDLSTATRFYTEVLGWTWAGRDDTYQMGSVPLSDGSERLNCGAMPMPPQVPAEVPSHWGVYFTVGDCDAAVAQAVQLGGSVWLPAMAMGPGRFAGVADPTGGMIYVGTWPEQDPSAEEATLGAP